MSMEQLEVGSRSMTRHKNNMLKLVAISLLFCSLGAQAQTIYHLDRTVGPGTVTGTITVDNNAIPGQIGPEDIIDWSFETNDNLSDPPPAHGPITISAATGGMTGGDAWNYFSATETELLFDFDGAHADVNVFGIGFNGGGVNGEGAPYSVHYNFAGFINGKLEQLIHFFDDNNVGDTHYVEAVHSGVVVVASVDSTPPPPPAPAPYDYQLLDYPGAPNTQIFGVNERGDVVGNGISGDVFPFVYSSTHDTLTDVAPAAGYASTAVLGISDSGVMVGSVTSLDLSTSSGFIRDKDGTFTFFSHPDAVSVTLPRAVNNDGLVSGFRNSPDGRVGFIYDPETETFTDMVPSLFTIAHGINAMGEVVGSAIFSNADAPCPDPVGSFPRYGWLRAADGSVTYFQIDGQRTSARGINDAGFVVGDYRDPGSGNIKGFIMKFAGVSSCESVNIDDSDVLEFPGASSTVPEGITNSGDIVGLFSDALGNHGFIATPH